MGISYTINVEVDTKQFQKKLDKFQKGLQGVMKKTVQESIDLIDQNAMNNLNMSLKWGHGLDTANSIANSKVVEYPEITPTRVRGTLSYTSPHASLVEYGGFGTVYATDKPFPIGASEGMFQGFSEKFQLQQGKFYLTTATVQSLPGIYDIANKNIQDLINSL
jgi:hypothetical protein